MIYSSGTLERGGGDLENDTEKRSAKTTVDSLSETQVWGYREVLKDLLD